MADLREFVDWIIDHNGAWTKNQRPILEKKLAQALAAEPTESLDAAWATAEAALPEGWVMEFGNHDKSVGGYWAQGIGPDYGDGHEYVMEQRRTPAAALNALSQALRSEQEKA